MNFNITHHRVILIVICIIISLSNYSSAQITQNTQMIDSIPSVSELSEVTVNANRVIRSVNSITVFPTKEEERAAIDAFDLVKRLSISKIIVIDNSISTIFGDNVAIFINGIPASVDEMNGVDVLSISKVEYIEFPQDSKYLGENFVISIHTKDPISGGFTKAYLKGDYADKFSENTNLMSKFTYKRMIYDIILTQQFAETDKLGFNKEQSFIFNDGVQLLQNQTFIDGYSKSEKYGGTFRAIYNTQNVIISNKVGLTYNANPHNIINYYNSIQIPEHNFNSDQKTYSKSLSPSWIGDYNFILPKNFSLSFNGEASYSRNQFNQSQRIRDIYTFDNKVKEDVFKLRSTITVQKNLNRAGMLRFLAIYWYNFFNMDYIQNSVSSIQNESNEYFSGALSYSIPIRYFMIYTQIGANYRHDKVSPSSYTEMSPYANIVGSWNFGRNNAQINLYYGKATYDGAMLNPTPLQVDNFLYVKGNPELKSSPLITLNGYYGYSASNVLQLSFFGRYHHFSNPATIDYVAFKDYIIANRVNSGTYQSFQAAVRGDIHLLNQTLVLSLTPIITGSKITGINMGNCTAFKFNAEIFYYLKNWNFGVFYYGGEKAINEFGSKIVTPSLYGLQIGWGNDSWNVSFAMGNPFRNIWSNTTEKFNSLSYSYNSRGISPRYHRNFSVGLAYTIGYGKKTSHETIENIENFSSAILH